MAHVRPIAFLLGLEGMALLRAGAEDGFDAAFVDARLAEIRTLCDEARPGTFLDTGGDAGHVDTRTGYATWADTYDTEDNPLIALEDPIVRDLLAELSPGTALDAACGTGRHSATLSAFGHQVIGVDSSPEMLATAAEKVPDGRFLFGELAALPVPSASVDLVVCALALTHQPALAPAFREFARVLRPGGRLVTSDIHMQTMPLGGVARAPSADGAVRFMPASRFLASDYLAAARAVGLRVEQCIEPRWGAVKGEGGPLAQFYCADAAAAAYRDTPAAIIWTFRLEEPSANISS